MSTLMDPFVAELKLSADLQVESGGLVRWKGEAIPGSTDHERHAALTTRLYSELHSGIDPNRAPTGLHKSVADTTFAASIVESTPHRSRPVVVPSGSSYDGGDLLVRIAGVRVRVPHDRVVARHPGGLATIELPTGRPNLSTGFHYVFGTRQLEPSRDVLRVYLHIAESAAAPAVWSTVLSVLESAEASYDAKILTRVRDYPRRDAMVVYLDTCSRSVVPQIAAATRILELPPETSVFVRTLAPGVGAAWEPDPSPTAGSRKQSFGEHRAGCVARALLHWHGHPATNNSFESELFDAFVAENVDPVAVYRNFRSPSMSIEQGAAI